MRGAGLFLERFIKVYFKPFHCLLIFFQGLIRERRRFYVSEVVYIGLCYSSYVTHTKVGLFVIIR